MSRPILWCVLFSWGLLLPSAIYANSVRLFPEEETLSPPPTQSFVKTDTPNLLHQVIIKNKRIETAGIVLTTLSIPLVALGAWGLLYSHAIYGNAKSFEGMFSGAAMVFGTLSLCSGIPLWIVGNIRKNNAKRLLKSVQMAILPLVDSSQERIHGGKLQVGFYF